LNAKEHGSRNHDQTAIQRNTAMTFDEIRELLAQTAVQQQENARALEESRKGWSEALEESRKGWEETKKIVASNARAIEANASAIADLRELTAEHRRDFEASMEDLMELATESAIRHEEHATFIRGLQRENRQILRELRDRRRGEGR